MASNLGDGRRKLLNLLCHQLYVVTHTSMKNGNKQNSEHFMIRSTCCSVPQPSKFTNYCIYSHIQVFAGAQTNRTEHGRAVFPSPGAFAQAMQPIPSC